MFGMIGLAERYRLIGIMGSSNRERNIVQSGITSHPIGKGIAFSGAGPLRGRACALAGFYVSEAIGRRRITARTATITRSTSASASLGDSGRLTVCRPMRMALGHCSGFQPKRCR